MKDIKYIKGDATNPIGEGRKIIIHVCNDIGKWGAGFVLALSRKWKDPESQYKKWSKGYIQKPHYSLGQVQFVKAEEDIVVGNMLGQHGTGFKNGIAPIRYSAINKCLSKVQLAAFKNDASVHAPRFGSGLAGGKWDLIEEMIISNLSSKGIQVTIYDL